MYRSLTPHQQVKRNSREMTAELPQFSHILETVLYTKNIEQARNFYKDVLKLRPIDHSPRALSFELGNSQLLIFALGHTLEDLVWEPRTPQFKIAKHGPSEHIIDVLMDGRKAPAHATSNSLRQHYCLAVRTPDEVEKWQEHLSEMGVPILGKMKWDRGGFSFYFADTDGHIGEIASHGLWPSW